MWRITMIIKNPVLVFILLFIIGIGCGTQKIIVPQVDTTTKVDFFIRGKIIYEGKIEYLPSTIINDNTMMPSMVFKYTHNTVYGKDNTSQLLPLFNPLSLVGFPIGGNTLLVAGTMEVIKKEKIIKSYTATCGFDVTRNLFYEGDTYTELRKEGLLEIKRNIEIQMYLDRESLVSLLADE